MAQLFGSSALSDPKERLALRSQEFKLVFLGLTVSLPSLFDPGMPILATELLRAGGTGNDMPIIVHDGEEEKNSDLDARSARKGQ